MLKKRIIIITILLAVGFLGLSIYNINEKDKEILPNYVRLHIIANSNNAYDQALKLMVRDEIVKILTPLLTDAADREAAAKIVKENIPVLEEAAKSIVKEAGYGARSEYGIFDFPERKYEDLTLAAGKYEALRIVLGEGNGKNWWCVLFPPLCFVPQTVTEETSVPAMKNSENNNNSTQVKLKLGLLELFN